MKYIFILFSLLGFPFKEVGFMNRIFGMLFVIVVAVLLPAMEAHADWVRTNYITASDLAGSDWFGDSVAVEGDILVAGAPFNNDIGSAYIFNTVNGEEIHKLTAFDGAKGDFFGSSVAVSENTIVVGAPGDDDNGDYSGSVYVFDAASGDQIRKLTAADGAEDDTFGHSVAVSGNIIVVGAYLNNLDITSLVPRSGAVYIFDVSTGNQIHKLTGSDEAWFFGYSVAVNEDRIVVGSLEDGGAVYVFDAASGMLSYKLSPFEVYEGDHFGWSVAVSDEKIVVGAPRPGNGDDEINPFGSVFVYDGITGNEIHKFIPSDGIAWYGFGKSVAVHENTIVIGATGSVYVYDAITGTEVQKLSHTDETSTFYGEPIAMDANRIMVGRPEISSMFVYEFESIHGIDFETMLPGNYPALSIDDYEFSPTWNTHVKVYNDGQTTSISPVWNDSLQLEHSNGQPFDLQSFDYIGRWPGISSHAEITGTLSDGSLVQAQVDYDATGWKTKTLYWKGLVHLAIYTPGGRLQMDNFVFGATSEPETILNFENQAVGEYTSVVEGAYNLFPLKRNTLSIYSNAGNQSITPYWNDTLRLVRLDGGSFDLKRFDYANRWSTSTVGTVTVVGRRQDGSQIIDSFTFPLIYWNKRTLNWTDLIQVDFISANGRVLLDNMEVSAP